MHQYNQGFTLVELLVSLFILSIALAGAFAVISFNVNNANFVKNSFIASGLAQEGVELVRNLRDTDWHTGAEFGSFGGSDSLADGAYRVQWDSSELDSSGVSEPLALDAAGVYAYDSGTPTIFRREVELRRVVPASGPVVEIVATVTVSWNERSGEKTVIAEEHLFNWLE